MCQRITLNYAYEYFQMCNPWPTAGSLSLPGIGSAVSKPKVYSGAWAASNIPVPGPVEEQPESG